MVAVRFPLLTAPIAIGPLALRNRMVLCPMGDDLANPDGTVSRAQLDHYEARVDGGAWELRAEGFDWPMHEGENVLEVRPVNVCGREGITSRLEVAYAPAKW